jgi:chromosomal replication initiation ATPase DnaA
MTDDIRIQTLRDEIKDIRIRSINDRPNGVQQKLDELCARRDALISEIDEIETERIAAELGLIERAVCGVFHVTSDDLRSRSRKRQIADARHAVVYAAWKKKISASKAADHTGRTPSLGSHALGKMIGLYERDERIREMLDEVMFCVR